MIGHIIRQTSVCRSVTQTATTPRGLPARGPRLVCGVVVGELVELPQTNSLRYLIKENVMAEDEKRGLLGKAVHAGERVVEIGVEAARLKARASHAVEDTMVEARRLAKRGRYAAEDLVDETAYRIKRDPLRSVAVTFAVGLGIGALAGWLCGRNGRR